jgi:hypothetical protein
MSNTEWTPFRGLMRATVAALVTSAVLSACFFGIIAVAPVIPLNVLLRVVLAFAVTWLVFAVVHASAGMVGWACTTIAVSCAFAVMLSNHAAWAVLGCPAIGQPGVVTGWSLWFDPEVMLIPSVVAAIGVGFGAALCHSGAPGTDFAGYLLHLSR